MEIIGAGRGETHGLFTAGFEEFGAEIVRLISELVSFVSGFGEREGRVFVR